MHGVVHSEVPILLFSFFVSFGACRKAGGFDNDADKDALFTGVAFLVRRLLPCSLFCMCVRVLIAKMQPVAQPIVSDAGSRISQ